MDKLIFSDLIRLQLVKGLELLVMFHLVKIYLFEPNNFVMIEKENGFQKSFFFLKPLIFFILNPEK